MENLKPLIGTWNAVVRFHDKGRRAITEEAGTYKISSVLEGTYLEEQVEFHHKDDPSKHHSFFVFVTYNPVSGKYDSTYIYSRWALRVTESGEYDQKSREYRTTAFIPLEDGKRDENVRTITKLGENDHNDESAEHLDLDVTLAPKR